MLLEPVHLKYSDYLSIMKPKVPKAKTDVFNSGNAEAKM